MITTQSLIVEIDKTRIILMMISTSQYIPIDHKNPIAEIPITTCPVNAEKQQILIGISPTGATLEKLHIHKQIFSVQFSNNETKQDIIIVGKFNIIYILIIRL